MRRFWTLSSTALLSLALIAGLTGISIAEKGGKGGGGGGGGGEDPPPATPPVTYDITWLPTPAGSASNAQDVNVFDTAVGYTLDGNSVWTAVVWPSSGGMIDLNVELADLLNEGERLTSAREINNAGRIAGHGEDADGNKRVFIYDKQLEPALQWLPAVADIRHVRDLTENGTVLIQLETRDGSFYGIRVPVVWNPDVQTVIYVPEISSLLDSGGTVQGLNDSGVIVGGADSSAFYYQLGADAPVWLPDFGKDSYALDISNGGIIAGEISSNALDPARWINGVPTLLTELAENENAGSDAVNEDGQIIGNVRTGTNRNNFDRPFIFDPADGFWKIDDLVDASDPDAVDWFLAEDIRAEGIAEGIGHPYGSVVGLAIFENGVQAFVLTPIPVP